MNMPAKLKMNEIFDPEMLRAIEGMNCEDARSQCVDLIQKTSTRETRKNALLRDIKSAPNSKELSRIMWNVMLAGEGLATTNSAWQRSYK